MSLDGAGSYQPPAPEFPAVPNTTILANDFNTIILDIAAALSMAIFRDGQAAFTANQSHGGFKITNLKNGTAPQDAVTFLQVFTDPSFVATTADGVKITGTAMKTAVTNFLLTATTATLTATLLDASGSTEVKLPANTSIGPVAADELAILNGLLTTTAELNILHGVTATTAELNILDGATVSTAQLNALGTVTVGEIGFLSGVTSPIQMQLDGKAALDSPIFINNPRAPTAPVATSTTQIATTEFVMQAAFQSGLPFQDPSTVGKVPVSDGTIAHWESLPPSVGSTLYLATNLGAL